MDLSLLASSLRVIITTLNKALRKRTPGSSEYSLTELETLGLLWRNDRLLPTELAAHTHITVQSMSQVLKKLEENALITRTPSVDDGRKTFIALAEKGKDLINSRKLEKDRFLADHISATLTPGETGVLAQAIPILQKLTSVKQAHS